ncbi:hypothetical protein GLE_5514 [Lysobacter enzymogenes]|uniref:Uncharacterized protein n=1 Tax=Lysobacter enzymogenes TaxID=69 RepID=A0A0S2DQL0_LYSEN|nr:hypothetical protein GLE_5514 [Lysobacter enzymogenes]
MQNLTCGIKRSLQIVNNRIWIYVNSALPKFKILYLFDKVVDLASRRL